MRIDEHDLFEFMRLYEDEFAESSSLEEAREMTSRLVSLYEVLSKPLADEIDQQGPRNTENQ